MLKWTWLKNLICLFVYSCQYILFIILFMQQIDIIELTFWLICENSSKVTWRWWGILDTLDYHGTQQTCWDCQLHPPHCHSSHGAVHDCEVEETSCPYGPECRYQSGLWPQTLTGTHQLLAWRTWLSSRHLLQSRFHDHMKSLRMRNKKRKKGKLTTCPQTWPQRFTTIQMVVTKPSGGPSTIYREWAKEELRRYSTCSA